MAGISSSSPTGRTGARTGSTCTTRTGSCSHCQQHFAGARLRRSFDTVHRRAQDAARSRLHAAAENGHLSGFVHAYLGMSDERLPVPVADLVPRASVQDYPTDFKAMTETDQRLISTRGEQLTRALLGHYCPRIG